MPVAALPGLDYATVRAASEAVCAGLADDDLQLQAMPEASPLKWHLAHTTWFFEAFVLLPARCGHRAPPWHALFNSYYRTLGEPFPRAQRALLSRPTAVEVRAWRTQVDAAMMALAPHAPTDVRALIELGLHHEQQHQELMLTDLKAAAALHPLAPALRPDPVDALPPPPGDGWIDHAGGVVAIGADDDGFAFDNERPRHRVLLAPFRIAAQPVSNGEVIAFIADGGYHRPEWWLSDGWDAARRDGWSAPLYWQRGRRGWQQRTLAGPAAIDPAQPACHLSYYEADALARWAGARLPTEAEWEAAEPSLRASTGRRWEWTASAYAPYPGFRPAAGALGEYNGKFMCSQQVLRGGSCATPAGHLRPTYRNFFPPSARWQYAGARLARDA